MTSLSDPSTVPPPRLSPLHAVHDAAGATFTDFAGWQMPVRYTSDLAEHHAVRSAAGLFDLSHMAEFLVTGADAGAFLDLALAGRLSAIAVGQAKYSLLLADDGGVIDDVVVYRLAETDFLVVANAANREVVSAALTERVAAAGGDAVLRDVSDETALIAVQGPASAAILARLDGFDAPGHDGLRYYRVVQGRFRDERVLVARTGYTGEDGFELYIAPGAAADLWRALVEAGRDEGLVPAGLASRDTLRLEAGMPLYGHELSRETLPVQAGLGRVAAIDKPEFVGREALIAGPAAGAPVLVGLVAEGRRAARAGYLVFPSDAPDAEPVGVVTSGALSPTLGHPIALAYVDPAHAAPGAEMSVDIRGRRLAYRITTLPFYSRKKD